MKRKMRKFSEGDVVEDFAKDASDRIQSSANMGSPAKSESYMADPDSFVGAKKQRSFKEEFNDARAKGKKVFTWNGKSYSTELASEKPAIKSKAKDTGSDESAAETSRLIRAAAAANKANIKDKPLEEVHPETMLIGGPGLKTLQRGAKALAEASAARKAAAEVAARVEPRLGIPRPVVRASDRIEPTFKKGGSVSSASKRADGCAVRGKTKGKIY